MPRVTPPRADLCARFRLSLLLLSPPCDHPLSTILLELPVSVVEGADLTRLQPAGNAVEMESVITNTPGNGALLARSGCLVCLTLDTEIHNVIPADSTVIDDDVPSPQSNGIPLLDFESLLVICSTICCRSFNFAGSLLGWG